MHYRWLLGSIALALAAAPATAQTMGSTSRPVSFELLGGVNVTTLSVPLLPPENAGLGCPLRHGGLEVLAGHGDGSRPACPNSPRAAHQEYDWTTSAASGRFQDAAFSSVLSTS